MTPATVRKKGFKKNIFLSGPILVPHLPLYIWNLLLLDKPIFQVTHDPCVDACLGHFSKDGFFKLRTSIGQAVCPHFELFVLELVSPARIQESKNGTLEKLATTNCTTETAWHRTKGL